MRFSLLWKKTLLPVVIATLGWVVLPGIGRADILFVGSSGARAATVNFSQSGSTLTATLTNTASADAMVPIDILTGVFFNLAGDPSLSRTSAVVAAGSSVFGNVPATDPGGVVGGEWSYLSGISGSSPNGANQGISSSGLGIFGSGNLFPGTNLQGPASPDGLQYGITTAGDNSATGNGGISGIGLIQNSVVFTLGGLPSGFNLSTDITNVLFQYGTALDEPSVPGNPPRGQSAPEPATAVLLGLGMLGAGAYRFARRKNAPVVS